MSIKICKKCAVEKPIHEFGVRMTRYALLTDKPRLTLVSAWYDCGWRYESWMCVGGNYVATASTPAAAYHSWKRMVER